MERSWISRSALGAAFALALAAVLVIGGRGALAQDDVVVPIQELNGSGVSGDASLIDNGDGTTTVDILLDGATGDHPAHIHSGTCDVLGDVVYPLTDVDASGASVTVIDVPLSDLLTTGPYAINIHLSAEDIATYVACGDIPQEAVGGETATESAPAEATPAAVGGTSTVTDIGTSGVGSTFEGSLSWMSVAFGALAALAIAGAVGVRRRDQRS